MLVSAPARSARSRVRRADLSTRLLIGTAVLVLACGGFFAYRTIAAIEDAYRWTGEAEAATVARGFAQSLAPGDVRDLDRLRARARRLAGVHPDLTGATVTGPAGAFPDAARYTRTGEGTELVYPLVGSRGRRIGVLTLRFALFERAEAAAAGRREVLLAGVRAGLLLII